MPPASPRPRSSDTFVRPHEMEFGPDGSLYVIDWGDGFGGNNASSGIYRIDYVAGARRPIAHASSNVDNGPTPLTVQFSSDGSQDPDGTPLTYAWDFDGNGTTDSTAASPTHTYNDGGHVRRHADGHRRRRPDGLRHDPDHGRQHASDGHDHDPRGRPVRRLRRHRPLRDHGHRPRGRAGQLQPRHAQPGSSGTTSTRTAWASSRAAPARSGRPPTPATARTRTSSRRSSRATRTTRRARPAR